jgi:hypothetical protein
MVDLAALDIPISQLYERWIFRAPKTSLSNDDD